MRTAALAMLLVAAPAAGQGLARLATPVAIAGLLDRTCIAAYPHPATALPAIAARERWDRLGTKGRTTDGAAGWLVSLGGQPAIIDVSAPSPWETCSLSTTTAPDVQIAYWKDRMGRAPDQSLTDGTVEKRVWAWRSAGVPGSITLTTQPGQPMARITIASGPMPDPARGVPVR